MCKRKPGGISKDTYTRLASRKILVLFALSLVFLVILTFSLVVGSANVGLYEFWHVIKTNLIAGSPDEEINNRLAGIVILNLRLPRVLLATLAGCSLAGAGVVMQGILRNPLADPYVLGISAGASFGAALAVVLGLGKLAGFTLAKGYLVIACAFSFGLLTTLIIYGVASLRGLAPETLILAGVALGYLFSAGVSLLKYLSSHEELRELTLWLMGGLTGAKWQPLLLLFPICLGTLGFLWYHAWDLNALGAGEEVAANLGVNLARLRRNVAVGASMLASATVAFTGIIGFIGLVAPHVGRFLVGSDYRYLFPASCLLGAILLLGADTLARTVASPIEVPVGVITSLIGVPFFLSLLFRERRRWWS